MSTYQDNPNYQLKRIREISNQADKFYADAVALGDHAAHAFGGRSEHRAQMTGLESIANSTYKVSDVYDYVKKQTARHREWQQPYSQSDAPNDSFGERLLKYLRDDLARKRDEICNKEHLVGNTTDEDQQERRHIHLLLMREFIRQMVVEYEYAGMANRRGR